MRVYGRIFDTANPDVYHWVEVDTAPDGSNDFVYATALTQVLKLNLGESPFFANYGIPGRESVQYQIPPDIQVAITQQQYAPFFASLIITRTDVAPTTLQQIPLPTYSVRILTHQGVQLAQEVPT